MALKRCKICKQLQYNPKLYSIETVSELPFVYYNRKENKFGYSHLELRGFCWKCGIETLWFEIKKRQSF